MTRKFLPILRLAQPATYLIIALSLLIFLPVSPAFAVVVETITTPLGTGNVSGTAFMQTFTPTQSGFITQVTIEVAPDNPGRHTTLPGQLILYAGAGPVSSPVLVTQSVNWLPGASNVVTLATPVPVTAGATYTVQATNAEIAILGSITDPYTGGELWIVTSGTWLPCQVSPFCAGSFYDQSLQIVIDDGVDPDGDGDGILDIDDNCPADANPSQENFDGDAQGDVCDPDDDNDGVDDINDAFPMDPSETTDSDSDTVGDNSDNCPTVANPNQENFDGDAQGDVCDPDDDNDGQTDTDEIDCGSDPLDVNSLSPDANGDGIPYCVDPNETGLIYLSSNTGGSVGGVSFQDEDVLVYDMGNASWAIFFDGSDVGLGAGGARDVNAFTMLDDGSLLFSFEGATGIPGVGGVDDSDLVRFVPTSLGSNTAGAFELYLDGSDVKLTTNGEDITAVSVLNDGKIVISTLGTARVEKANGQVIGARDEDMLVFTPTQLGRTTEGSFDRYLDGSDLALTTSAEDIWGASFDNSTGDLYLSTLSQFTIPGLSGDSADIFDCQSVTSGYSSACAGNAMLFDGSQVGFGSEKVDALHIDRSASSPSQVSAFGLRSGTMGNSATGDKATEDEAGQDEEDLLDDVDDDPVIEPENGDEMDWDLTEPSENDMNEQIFVPFINQ